MSSLLQNLNQIPNPCFVLDEELFVRNLRLLRSVERRAGVNILCALKGFAMWSVFPEIVKHISGGTASSLDEVRLIKEEMAVQAHSCFVVYSDEEFNQVQDYSSHITFNSLSQYNKYHAQFREDIRYAIRVNPDFSPVEFEQYNPCMPGSRFGVVKEQLPNKLPKGVTGLHFHALCESSAQNLEDLLNHIEENFGHLLHQAKWVNLGGGHHITKEGYDVEHLIELVKSFKENYGLEELILEPGEAIGWQTGYLISRVEDVVSNNGEQTAILNVSFSAHMPDCLEMPYKPSVWGEVDKGVEVTLGGNTCMSGDFVKGFKFKQELVDGDIIVFEDMAHYTFVKTTFFNGVKHPGIGIWKTSDEFQLIRSFDHASFKSKLS